MSRTKITWSEFSWNPVTGCTKVAEGCKNCYAESMAKRFWGKRKFTDVKCHEDRLDIPLHWRKPRKVFVCSMGDLFHEDVPFEYIDKVMAVIVFVSCREQPHISQILTKRPERMLEYYQSYPWKRISKIAEDKWGWLFGAGKKWFPENLWLGTSISTQADLDRVWQTMRDIPAAIKFYSFEPALEGIDFERPYLGYIVSALEVVDWVIIGCESGPKRRPCRLEWVKDVIRQCDEAGVSVFVKQLDINGKVSHNPKEWPEWARRQEFPK